MAQRDFLKTKRAKYEANIAKAKEEAHQTYLNELAALDGKAQQMALEDFLEDEPEFDAQLERMGIILKENRWQQYVNRQPQVNADLLMVHLQPNNVQFGCAVAALCDKRRPRSIISVPSGKGKSRIIAAAVALAARYVGVQNFTIVYSSELLKSVDTMAYDMLGSLLKIQIKQVVFDKAVGLKN